MATKKRILFFCILLSLLCPLYAEGIENTFKQRIEWSSSEGAYQYKLEVAAEDSENSNFYTTENNFYELHLLAGKYKYRVYVYDFLGQESARSEWSHFIVNKASVPQIKNLPSAIKLPANSTYLVLELDIEDVAAAALAELINTKDSSATRGALVVAHPKNADKDFDREGSEVLSAKEVVFHEIEPGTYSLRITNPSGLSATSAVIEIQEAEPPMEVVQIDEVPEEYYSAIVPPKEEQKEEEPKEPPVEEEPEPIKEEPKVIAEAEPVQPVVKEEPKEEPKKEPPKEEPKNEEKKYLELNFLAGGGIIWSPYSGNIIKDHSDSIILPSLDINMAWLPFRFGENQKLGFELNGIGTIMGKNATLYTEDLYLALMQLSILYRHRIFLDNLYISLKLGGGVAFFYQYVEYLSYYNNRGQTQKTTFLLPSATVGTSMYWLPAEHIALEVGVSFSHVFNKTIRMGLLNPYICLGLRF